MSLLKVEGLARALAGWAPANRLLLLAGPDESASADAAAAACRALADPNDPMALVDLPAQALRNDPGRLADEAAAVSMFGAARLIRVTGADDTAAEAVRLLLEAPVSGNPVVMQAGELGKQSALRNLAEASPHALLLISYQRTPAEAAGWLRERAASLGLRPAPGIAERIVMAAGSDSGIMARELEKYALYLGAAPDVPQRLEAAHLAALGADGAEEDLFALVAALMADDRRAVERQLRLFAPDMAIGALRAVARRLMQMAEARARVDAGEQPVAATKALRPPVFWKEQPAFAAALQAWPGPRIRAGLAAILAGERRIKQAGGPGPVAGWQAIIDLLPQEARRRGNG